MDKAREAFSAVAGWDGADVILLLSTPEQTPFMPREFEYRVTTKALIEWAKLSPKPVVLALNVNTMPGDDGIPEKSFIRLQEAGFAVFPSAERAATALTRVYRYYQWRRRKGL